MFLKEIALHNFKNLPNVQLSFVVSNEIEIRKWTFILGENGTGKSSVLKAIALITAGSDALGEILGDADEWIRYGESSCKIEATLVNAEKEERNISIEINRGDTLKQIIRRSYESLEEIDSALRYAKRNYFIVGYGANRKLANQSRSNGSKNYYRSLRANSVATLFHREVTLRSLEDWAIDLDYVNDANGLNIISNTLNTFLPEITFDGIDKKQKKLIFNTKDGKIPLDQLSEGYQNMTAWVGDVLFQLSKVFDDYEEPLSARGVLLIDELELHLHPKWQRQLVKLINSIFPNFQIISTTHSPLTAQQANEGELFVLKRDQQSNNINLAPYLGNPSYMPVNQLLISNMFDLATDESLKLEEKKKRYRELKDRTSLSQVEKNEFSDLKDFLLAQPIETQTAKEKAKFELIEKLAANL